MQEKKLTKEDIDRVRDIEGFPIAKDEDIIALSRPPYYTACPNPFLADFIQEYGIPYNEETDSYQREPFAADVSEGKSDPIYNAHSYHTKVPYKAIMRYILHYTNPGDIVFDGFCGTGMTGVAAQMCGFPDAEQEYLFNQNQTEIEWGSRKAILCDLSPIATFIAYNYNKTINVVDFEREANNVISESQKECNWVYETYCVDSNGNPQLNSSGKPKIGKILDLIWSDVFVCPTCSKEFSFYDVAFNVDSGDVAEQFECPHCRSLLKKKDCNNAVETVTDPFLNTIITKSKKKLSAIRYIDGKKRYLKKPDEHDLYIQSKIENYNITSWVPIERMTEGRESRRNDKFGITHVHQFYERRNLYALSDLFSRITKSKYSEQLTILFTSQLINLSKLNRYRPQVSFPYNPLSGTLYVSSLNCESNCFVAYENKLKKLISAYSLIKDNKVIISCQSSTKLNIPDNSIDYIFTDPPFGSNLDYSELSFIWEAWLKVKTNNNQEAIINKTQNKGLKEYQVLMESCFREFHRVLKPGRWMTVEFHNSQNSVWNAITEALLRSGFVVADVRTLDKKQGSFKQVTAASAVKQDLIISIYKPTSSFIEEFEKHAGDPDMAWEFVRQHLQNVPKAPDSTGKIEVVTERQDYLLFDRMVAFHIMRGIPVPMDANTFYAGLRERFIQRDGMFFLADQVNEYDERRQKMELQDQQLSLFISDEKSAIIWLNVQFTKARQSYSEIQPKYLQELHQAKFEQMPELLDMLKENFLLDEDNKWYVPNLSDRADLDKLRRKRLLKDFFDIYAKGTGQIKNARTEAIRVGFDECWKERNYSLIVKVGNRLPDTVLQEDPALLMYYDNAANRM